MPIDQKILDEINSSLTAAPAVTGPNSIPSVNPDNLGRSLKLVRTKGGYPLVEAEDTEALDMAERQAAWDRLVSSAPKTVGHFAQNPIAAAVADNDWEPVGAVENSLFALGEAARIPYQAGTGITGSLYGILGAATEVGNTLASSAQRTAADLFSRLFLPPARQGQGKPTLDSLAGPMSPESDVSKFFRSASAGVAKLGREYGTASGNYGGDIGRMVAGGAASAYQNAMMLGFAGTIAPAVAGTRMAVAAPMAPMGLVTAGGEYTKARDAGLSVGQSLAYAGSQGGIEMATEALPFGILVRDIKASMPIAKIIGRQLLAENLEEQVATHAQDFNEWINLHPDKTIGEYLKERPNAALETAVQTTVATLLLAGPGSIAMRATYLDMQRADEAMAQKRADALTALNTAAAASKTLQRDRQTFEEIVAAQTKEGPVTDVYIDAQVLNQSGLADQVVADSPSAAEQYQAALETGGQIRIPVSEYAARIAPQTYAQELVEDVRFDPLDMTLREAKDYQQSGAMQELEAAVARIIGDKAQDDSFTASRDTVKQRVLDNLNALGRFTPQKNELDATLIAARSATRAAQLGVTPEQFFNDYLLKVTAQGVGGESVLNQDGTAVVRAEPTGKTSPITKKPIFEVFGADGRSAGLVYSYNSADEAVNGFNESRQKKPAEPAAPTYAAATEDLPQRSNWKQVKGQKFAATDENDGYLYHVTAAPNAPGIRADGLVPGSSSVFGGAYKEYSAGKVFITERSGVSFWKSRIEDALQHQMDKPPSVVVMRIPREKVTATLEADKAGTIDARADAYYANDVLFQTGQPFTAPTIEIDGITRPTTNSAGNPIHSTEAGIRNFWKWFGDSKIVDEQGRPLVVYHGSRSTEALTDFVVSQNEPSDTRLKRTKDGAYFTRNPDKAAVYAGQTGRTYPVYLKISNPKMIADAFGSVEVDAAQLRAEGFDGLWNPKGFPSDEIVAIRKNQIKSATDNSGEFSPKSDNILYQPDDGPGPVKRGSFSPATNTIALLKNADLSTFLHESGHYFFETDIAIAGQILRENGAFGIDTMTPGQQQILRDVSALLKWHGIEGDIASQIDQWDRMDFEERRGYHEKTAESFERYLMEGKAPSIELQPVFQTFRQWLISVYKSIKDFLKRNPDAGELNPEVRAVFDRMLATEEEIKLAEQARGMLPLFADAINAGMTPAEFADYQKLGNEATQAAIDELQAKGIRDMKWLSNARSRMLKKLQKQAKAQRAEMRAAARTDVLSEPVYQAWNLLTSKMTDEDKLAGKPKRSEAVDPAVDSLFEAIAKLGGLNREALAAQWGIDPKDKAESGLFGKPVMRAKDGGRSLDWMVEALTEDGYLTPDENGKGDVLDLEERFRAELRGDRQYSSIRNWETEPLPGEGQDLGGITAPRIDRASLDAMEDLPQEVIDRLESLGMTAKTGGIHPDVLSEVLPGWTSGDELVRALASAVPMKQAIEARTDRWMLEQHADMATPEAIERAADMAIHNDARERFLLAEHKALAKASGDKTQRQIMLSAARDFARQLIGRQRIRDIRPGQYTAAEARAAKAAATSKDVAQKATEKRNQILSGMAAREAYRAQDDVDKGLRYLKKFDSPTIRKRVNGDYVDQIEALLEKIDLRKRSLKDIDRRKSFGAFVRSQIEKGVVPAMSDSLLPPGLRAAYLAKVMERDENGELIVRDDVEQAKVLADYLDMAETRSYKDMTIEEFRGLVETIRQIEHLGRKKKSLLTARDGKTYEQKRDELVASVTANAERLPERMNRTVPNDRAEKLRGLRDFRISLRKIGMIMRLLDGNKDGGPMWDFFVRSANERGDWETEQIANASEVLTKALRPVFTLKGGMRGKGVHFESIGRSLNREQRIGLALNVGNEGNLQRLLDGEGWTYADIQPVLESLTAAEWQAVQEVWDHMDSYRPLIAAIERRTVGGEPEWVQPMQFTVNTRDGQTLTLKGGYYPVKYDAEASQRAEELEDATDAKRAMNAATNTSTTHRSFVKKRSEAVVGRPLELSLSAMYSGVQDVIHDLAWREWLIDASKMISSSTLDDAIRRKYGAETPRAIRQWISDIAAGTRKPRGVFDRAAAFLRKNVAASGLALNFMNAVQNVTGLQNSIERIGAKWLAVGQGEYLSGPKEAAAWVHEKSSFMAHRARTQFRDLNEMRNVVENGDNLLTKAKNNQFILITMTQKMVDTPTWIGAYRKAEAEGAVVQLEDGSIDDSRAVAMADQAVIDSQGSGMTKDLSAVERGGELAKLFTAYYSYMNTTYNLAANRVSGARGRGGREKGSAALHVLTLMAVPTMLMAILKAALTPGDDDDWDDPEKLAKKLAMEQASFAMGMVPMVREFTPIVQPFLQDQTFGYQGPAGLRIIGDATKFAQQAAQGEFNDGFRKAAVGLSGSLFGLPAAQINRTWTGVEALADDKTDNPGALMFGYQEKK